MKQPMLLNRIEDNIFSFCQDFFLNLHVNLPWILNNLSLKKKIHQLKMRIPEEISPKNKFEILHLCYNM